MADSPAITFTNPEKHEGARAPNKRTLASQDGLVLAEVQSIKYGGKSGSGNHKWVVMFVTKDDDPGMDGVALWKHFPMDGTNSQGENIDMFYSFLSSTGTTKAQLLKLKNKQITAEAFEKKKKGALAKVEIGAKVYEGKVSSEIKTFCDPEEWDKTVAGGNHRTDHGYKVGAGVANGSAGQPVADMPPPEPDVDTEADDLEI